MEVNDLRVMKLRTYLMSVIAEINEEYKQLNVNFLSNDVNNYSLDKIPTEPKVEQWIIGASIKKDLYSFRSRMNYSADTISNIENIGFYETFEKKIEERNKSNILPDIDNIESVTCLNCGSMVNATTNTAEFDIQIEIDYRD